MICDSVFFIKRVALVIVSLSVISCGGGSGGGADSDALTYEVSGRVDGLLGSGLVLQINGGDNLPIAADGEFSFTARVGDGDTYAVTVATQPSKFLHECNVTKGSGIVSASNVTDIIVTCANLPFPQLFDAGVVYSNQIYVANGGDDITGDGSQLNPYESISKAASVATPGTQINIAAGTYNSNTFISGLTGTANAPIALVGSGTAIINPTSGWQLSKPRYVVLDNLTIEGESNGLNIDDGAEYANPDAAGFLIVKNSTISSTGTSNNDAIKLSGLRNFFVVNNTLSGAGTGSGIDCVGCHEGIISGNTISGSMDSGIQTKGGSADILIHGNVIQNITNVGARGINAGGNTNTIFYRPPLVTIASDPSAVNFEAARITMLSNVLSNIENIVAFDGCIDCVFANNTVVDPKVRVVRILQGTVSDATYIFAETQNGEVKNNIIRYSTVDVISSGRVVNIGANTQPGTYDFNNNLWWAYNESAAYVTVLPPEITPGAFSYNQLDPLFTAIPGDLRIGVNSPAIGLGTDNVTGAIGRDFDDRDYQTPPALGAFAAP